MRHFIRLQIKKYNASSSSNKHIPYDICCNKSANDPPEWAVRCWRPVRLRQWRYRDPSVSWYQFRVRPFLCRPSFFSTILWIGCDLPSEVKRRESVTNKDDGVEERRCESYERIWRHSCPSVGSRVTKQANTTESTNGSKHNGEERGLVSLSL